ncbi:helix-turn-helix domain-containing protein [Micromonospora sp. NPDC006766]|uniref:helix-turn-helix domain-containing protein n=1 Tax=Micromonospora sp. NPDC006766 TaxID=3154778 RepID=UPI0033FEB993
MTDTQTTDTTQLVEALARLDRARNLRDALTALTRLITEADEEARAAAIAAAQAGMTERAIAAKFGVSQPTVHSWLDGRTAAPLPAPTIGDRAWLLHQTTRAVETIVHRLDGEHLPPAPHSGATSARTRLAAARKALGEAAWALGEAGSTLERAGQ